MNSRQLFKNVLWRRGLLARCVLSWALNTEPHSFLGFSWNNKSSVETLVQISVVQGTALHLWRCVLYLHSDLCNTRHFKYCFNSDIYILYIFITVLHFNLCSHHSQNISQYTGYLCANIRRAHKHTSTHNSRVRWLQYIPKNNFYMHYPLQK